VASVELAAGCGRFAEYSVAAFDRIGHGLFEEHILARTEAGDGVFLMEVVGCADKNGVHIRRIGDIAVVGGEPDARAFLFIDVEAFGREAAGRDEPGAMARVLGFEGDFSTAVSTDDCEADIVLVRILGCHLCGYVRPAGQKNLVCRGVGKRKVTCFSMSRSGIP